MAVRDSEAVHQPQVAAKLTEMGLDDSIPSERRASILSALDTQKRFEPAALDRLTTFAKDADLRSRRAGPPRAPSPGS